MVWNREIRRIAEEHGEAMLFILGIIFLFLRNEYNPLTIP